MRLGTGEEVHLDGGGDAVGGPAMQLGGHLLPAADPGVAEAVDCVQHNCCQLAASHTLQRSSHPCVCLYRKAFGQQALLARHQQTLSSDRNGSEKQLQHNHNNKSTPAAQTQRASTGMPSRHMAAHAAPGASRAACAPACPLALHSCLPASAPPCNTHRAQSPCVSSLHNQHLPAST